MDEEYFLDTSALFKRYVREAGANVVFSLFAQDASRFISSLTLCEVVSNLKRLQDVGGLLTDAEFKALKASFLGEVGDGLLLLVEPTSAVILTSMEIIAEKYVTPLDAIQLATALSLSRKPIFVCADQKLIRLAAEYGLATLDPLAG